MTMTSQYPRLPLRRFIEEIVDGPFGSSLTSSHYSDDGARVIRLGNIGSAHFRGADAAYIPLEYFEELRRHQARPGDLVIAGLGDERHPVGRACIVPSDIGPAIVKADCFRARLDERRLTHRFAAWALSSSLVADQVSTLTRGSTRARINLEVAREIQLPVPPLEEQRRIADFLDAETAHVDLLVRARSSQRALLELRRWSYFQDALDNVPAGQIPLRRVLRSIIDGPFGSAFSSADYIDEGAEGAKVIRLGNIGFAEYRHQDQAKISLDMFAKFRPYEVREGDLLIAGLGDARNHAGRCCVAPDLGPAIVKGKCFRARLEPSVADAGFVALLLSSPLGAGAMEGRGSTRAMINLEIVKSAVLPIPALSVQRSVARATYKGWEKMRAAIDACDRQLDLLAERRQALITAAVTGQIDVSTASGRGIED
ncbi:restriction endonuclease subunit S [Planosporangium mesophilum]|nr:restriction endonuclease subunit S [Planosporangium mesophilum]NJC83918.1 hypothetical protein [Planosporangium mesophilum]